MNGVETENYRRVQKTRAKKLYEQGIKVYAISCKMRPDNPYEHPVLLGHWIYDEETKEAKLDDQIDFEKAVSAFEFFNCGGGRGRYTAFYVKKKQT